MTRCRSCNEPIDFGVNEQNGHRVPLNVGADPAGTVVRTGFFEYDGTPIVRIYPHPELAAATGFQKPRYSLHRLTCPKR